jgi:hypothetical protein
MVSYKVQFSANETPHVWTGKSLSEYVTCYFEQVANGELDCVRRKELIPVRVYRVEKGRKPVNVTPAVRAKLLGFTAYARETFARPEVKQFTPEQRRKLLYGKRATARSERFLLAKVEEFRKAEVMDEVKMEFAVAFLTEGAADAGGLKAFGLKAAAELK